MSVLLLPEPPEEVDDPLVPFFPAPLPLDEPDPLRENFGSSAPDRLP